MAYTFIISDESINTHGFIVRTAGINTERFRKNPVMLYMHERQQGIIGRWENIRTEGAKLLADAVFDEGTPLGKEVKERVDKGFLHSASIGITIIKHEFIDGTNTVTACELVEVSIVDIPANGNAVRLFNKQGLVVLSLQELDDTDKDLRTRLIELLKLSETATDDEIITGVSSLIDAGTSEPDKALKLGYIEPSQLALLKHMERTDRPGFVRFMQEREQAAVQSIEKEVQQAVRRGQIISPDRGIFENIGRQLGVSALREILGIMPEKIELSKLVGPDSELNNKTRWGLKEYRKYAPQELQNNPDLYDRLRKKEYGTPDEPEYDLAYYRKHRPEYLAQHPDVYEELLRREKTGSN